MFDRLYDFPAVLVIAGAGLLGLLIIMLTGPIARRTPPNASTSASALDAYKIIVTFTAILLSFSLVQANGLVHAGDSAVSVEAGALNQLDRVLLRYRSPQTDAIRVRLHVYIHAVLDQDWPAMSFGKTSSPAQARLGDLNRAVIEMSDQAGIKSQLYAEILKQLDVTNDTRQARMDSVTASLPVVFWQAIGILCLVLVGLSARIETPGRLTALGGHAIAIAVLTSLTFLVDQPHRGTISVSAAPIARTLTQVLARVQ